MNRLVLRKCQELSPAQLSSGVPRCPEPNIRSFHSRKDAPSQLGSADFFGYFAFRLLKQNRFRWSNHVTFHIIADPDSQFGGWQFSTFPFCLALKLRLKTFRTQHVIGQHPSGNLTSPPDTLSWKHEWRSLFGTDVASCSSARIGFPTPSRGWEPSPRQSLVIAMLWTYVASG